MRGPERRRALLIGTATYRCDSYPTLPCTMADTARLRYVLSHPRIGVYDNPKVVSDPTADEMRAEISGFLEGLGPDELGLLYISGHGVRLTESTGEVFFIASDSDDDVERTAVGATFVNEQLELCRAAQKVAILDCCHSGGIALGFRGRYAKSAARQVPLLTSRGVFVMSSSGADEESFGGGSGPDGGPQPSVFTGELVAALHTGKADADSDGLVSAGELFHYVQRKLKRRALPDRQIPVSSALNISDEIYVARGFAGGPMPAVAVAAPAPRSRKVMEGPPPQGRWPQLLEYYRRCVGTETTAMPLIGVDEVNERFVCLAGSERLLSGDLDEDAMLPVPPEAVELVERAAEEEAELWCGYPAVVLTTSPENKHYHTPRFAPLFIRRVEVVAADDGVRLRPYGEPQPHPQLAQDLLGADEAEQLLKTYQPTWHGAMHNQLVREANHLLSQELEVPVIRELDPENLDPVIDIRTPGRGARNSAVLFLVTKEGQAATQVVQDLELIATKVKDIDATALAALLDGSAAARCGQDWQVVAPTRMNEGQQAVLESAMANRLTVATGPPGTGKSQLVANLVATAVANGQKVLVASTNNRAVDVVWERCEQIVPGAIVRTGSRGGRRNYREDERNSLQRLVISTPAPVNLATARAELGNAQGRAGAVVTAMAVKAEGEKRLLNTGQDREQAAAGLGLPPGELVSRFSAVTDLDAHGRRAESLAKTWFFPKFRRRQFLRSINWPADPTAEICIALAAWFRVDARWRRDRESAAGWPDDQTETTALEQSQQAVRERSRTVLDSAVRGRAAAGKQQIQNLLNASAATNRKDWQEVKAVLDRVCGWAVTTMSIRRFPPEPALFDLVIIDEASQCSIPLVVPTLFRAKRALIIGDAMQLAPVITLKPSEEAQIRREVGISASWLEARRLTYHRHSAFHGFETARGSSELLDEHFRCHPAIAAISNAQFYANRLTVLTDVRAQRRLPDRVEGVMWADQRGKASRGYNGSWVNGDEVVRVVRVVDRLVKDLPEGSEIGVVTPYAAQAKALERRFAGYRQVVVGTVHRFQGGERDVMVFSLVASREMPKGSKSWLTGQLTLWNVAITRARSHLIVVGDREVWSEQGGVGAILEQAADQYTQEPSETVDPLSLRLFQRLGERPSVSVQLDAVVNGYRADATVTDGDGRITAVLLDRGCEDSSFARHLRLRHVRTALLAGERPAHRVPAWRLYAEDVQPIP